MAVRPLSSTNEIVDRKKTIRFNYFGRGKRKASTCFVVVSSPGTGIVHVNNREFIEYFPEDH